MRASGLMDNRRAYEGTYAAAFEGGKITGVVAHYWNQNLVFQSPDERDLKPLWQAAAQASGRPIGGLIGPNDQVARARQELGITASMVQMDEQEKLYGLALGNLAVPGDLSSGKVAGRRIESRDLELVTRWTAAYSVEAIGETDGPQLWEKSRGSVERSTREGAPGCLKVEASLWRAVLLTPPSRKPFKWEGYGRHLNFVAVGMAGVSWPLRCWTRAPRACRRRSCLRVRATWPRRGRIRRWGSGTLATTGYCSCSRR